ncbi:Cof-type HAD-IIB family hydrolase [Thermicanus aegyptius]|uniref:Cof-type HAD-IIB family hydrolase n=1 Tax=Thermicanus aegyptius TaxID=94009 RepID=UPI0004261623|nr:Cof-type HAD-IIB family hydrolase [Thermicanus aegyptius]
MKYTLLALDLDGTLFSSDMSILPRTKKVILDAIRDGLTVTLATGRSFTFAKEVAKELAIEAPLITHDGALVAAQLDHPLSMHKLSNSTVQKIIKILLAYPLRFELQHDPLSIVNYKRPLVDPMKSDSYKMLEYLGTRYVSNRDIVSYLQTSKLEPHKVSVSADTEQTLEEVKEALLAHLSDEIRITNAGFGVEIVPKNISKAYGLKVLSAALGISPSEIIAIGDNYNDLEMFQFAGLSIAMANAPQEVKNRAKYVTRSNDEDGIAFAIQTFFYGDEIMKEARGLGS